MTEKIAWKNILYLLSNRPMKRGAFSDLFLFCWIILIISMQNSLILDRKIMNHPSKCFLQIFPIKLCILMYIEWKFTLVITLSEVYPYLMGGLKLSVVYQWIKLIGALNNTTLSVDRVIGGLSVVYPSDKGYRCFEQPGPGG